MPNSKELDWSLSGLPKTEGPTNAKKDKPPGWRSPQLNGARCYQITCEYLATQGCDETSLGVAIKTSIVVASSFAEAVTKWSNSKDTTIEPLSITVNDIGEVMQ